MPKEIPDWRNKPWLINLYICPDCKMGFTAVNIHNGTTPLTLRCINRMDACSGRAMSQGYSHERPVPEHVPEPTYEFYKPTQPEMIMLSHKNPSVYVHCKAGGLAIRERDVGNEPQVCLEYVHHRIGEQQHAADTVLEILIPNEDSFFHDQLLEKGFYHFDETEAHAYGPYPSLPAAVVARNAYFKQL